MLWMGYFEIVSFSYNDPHKKMGSSKKTVAREKPFFDHVMFLLGVLINRKQFYNTYYNLSQTHRPVFIDNIHSWI